MSGTRITLVNGMMYVLKQGVWGGGGYTVHLGYLFGIRVKKNSELAELLRTYKGRVVFQGNQVYDQTYNYAIFQD